jgi:hypothetical protein
VSVCADSFYRVTVIVTEPVTRPDSTLIVAVPGECATTCPVSGLFIARGEIASRAGSGTLGG